MNDYKYMILYKYEQFIALQYFFISIVKFKIFIIQKIVCY